MVVMMMWWCGGGGGISSSSSSSSCCCCCCLSCCCFCWMFRDCREMELEANACDDEMAGKLWQRSFELCDMPVAQ